MNTKHSSSRVLGQRSIPSTFLFRSSNRSNDCTEYVKAKPPEKGSRVSLSDFLDRKLQKSSVPPKSVQGKERPFSSPLGSSNVSGSTEVQNDDKERGEAEVNGAFDAVFEKFKHTRKENEDCIGLCTNGEVGSSSTDDVQPSRKRSRPFEGLSLHLNHLAQSVFLTEIVKCCF
ncbi:unnamed protein product [Ilex paraguariensis]|uniref:Uncharacterized protein n=1 Tax=Ilex paraguariensis TaxID=185542 RepID=A0ABC8TYF8_9AQUA